MLIARSLWSAVILSAPLLVCGVASADWPSTPTANLPICTATNLQLVPAIATDLAGGAYIAWHDLRGGSTTDIYAQHVLASGVVDPTWPLNGVLVCGATGSQTIPRLVSDGSGGVLLGWTDSRSGTADIYAHHLLASGTVDPAWPANGLAVCTATGSQSGVQVVSDAAGGALLAWRDLRNDTDLYVMRVRSNGVVDPGWPADGLPLASGIGAQKFGAVIPVISDGQGGLFATWQDTRDGLEPDIYAQHLLVNGSSAAGWPANGLAVCKATNVQQFPSVSSDSAGGIFVGWEDLRNGTSADIYAQHVRASGLVDPGWPADGRAVCTATGHQARCAVQRDLSGGVYVVWVDYRAGSIPALSAQHLLANGTLDPAWPADDLAFNPTFGSHSDIALLPDGTGGALAVWDDGRNGLDVYAQHILITGVVDPTWPAGGRAVSNATSGQDASGAAIQDGSGGLIVAWSDQRSGSNDIYAQRVQANSQLGGTVVDVPRGGPSALSLSPLSPTPSRGDRFGLRFMLPRAGRVSLELIDIAGRHEARRDLGTLSAGPHELDWRPGARVAPGLHFVRLRFDGESRTVRAVTIN